MQLKIENYLKQFINLIEEYIPQIKQLYLLEIKSKLEKFFQIEMYLDISKIFKLNNIEILCTYQTIKRIKRKIAKIKSE